MARFYELKFAVSRFYGFNACGEKILCVEVCGEQILRVDVCGEQLLRFAVRFFHDKVACAMHWCVSLLCLIDIFSHCLNQAIESFT